MSDEDIVAHVCFCGSKIWVLDWVMFEDYQISAYSLSMKCAFCGWKAASPTEVDREV